MTYDEFEKKYLGKAVDFDGVAGVQCVDLVDQYLKDCFGITGVWCSGAKDLYNNFSSYPALVAAFDRVPNTPDLIVREGDIVIWGGGSWGHTGIGTGEGNVDWFVSLEENTLGRHEPTQKVRHSFANDISNPCLGVLRPKTAAEPKALDTDIWYKRGDKDKSGEHGIYCIKQRLKALGYNVDDTGGFGGGTEAAVMDVQRKMGYKPTGEIGEGFVKMVMK
jgi:hypothetical protein